MRRRPTVPDAWILYDARCGFCARWVPLWGPVLARQRIGIKPLQSSWARAHVPLSDAERVQDLTMVLEDGRIVRGADVYRNAMRRMTWALPLYVLSIAPGFRRGFDAAYRAFADNRYRISRACRLAPVDVRDDHVD